ncbi:hypothetical protein MMC29_002290 [Sticta canariensis]|nr:hypothetical protein [Sticta canariensis]
MASQPSNKNPEANHDAKIIAVIIVLTILSVVATVLRVVSRRMKKTKLGVEDYIVFVALALSMTQSFQVAAGGTSIHKFFVEIS